MEYTASSNVEGLIVSPMRKRVSNVRECLQCARVSPMRKCVSNAQVCLQCARVSPMRKSVSNTLAYIAYECIVTNTYDVDVNCTFPHVRLSGDKNDITRSTDTRPLGWSLSTQPACLKRLFHRYPHVIVDMSRRKAGHSETSPCDLLALHGRVW